MSIQIATRKVNDVTVLDLSGRLVLGEETSKLRETLKQLSGDGHKKILLNLKDVSYIDSSGLGALVGGYATVSGQQGQLKLVNLNNKVHDLLRVTKLLTVFEVFDDEGKAVSSFR
jgi:anti-sigma B factor antagonist